MLISELLTSSCIFVLSSGRRKTTGCLIMWIGARDEGQSSEKDARQFPQHVY